jgi:hypothetical protein
MTKRPKEIMIQKKIIFAEKEKGIAKEYSMALGLTDCMQHA